MGQRDRKLNMYEPATFRICIQGELDEKWFEYFTAQSVSIKKGRAGHTITTIISKPIDQGALVGLVNNLNALGIPLLSVEYRQTKGTKGEWIEDPKNWNKDHEEDTLR